MKSFARFLAEGTQDIFTLAEAVAKWASSVRIVEKHTELGTPVRIGHGVHAGSFGVYVGVVSDPRYFKIKVRLHDGSEVVKYAQDVQICTDDPWFALRDALLENGFPHLADLAEKYKGSGILAYAILSGEMSFINYWMSRDWTDEADEELTRLRLTKS